MIILIPAYEPDERLVRLAASIRAASDAHVVVVDDGSGSDYRQVFDAARALGCTVIGHATNRGKGHALKEGFRYVALHHPGEDVVCADCDGQHTLTGNLLASVVGARVISSTVNFLTNRRLVFAHGQDKRIGAAAIQYWTLAVALVAASFGLLSALTQAGLPLLAAKVLTEATLFAVSYQVQRRLVFTRPREARQPAGGAPTPATAAIGVRDGRARAAGAQ